METKIKVALLDFDGTLVSKDILDLLCKVVGKEQASQELNAARHSGQLTGVTALIQRINFLKGMTKTEIFAALGPENYLMPGAQELMSFFKQHQIITILASGNILPVLEYYQKLLGIDYIVGSEPYMDGETILGIDEAAFSSPRPKLDGIRRILTGLDVTTENIIAIGDSPTDKEMFEVSGYSIAFNPKGDIAEAADAVVENDLTGVVILIKALSA